MDQLQLILFSLREELEFLLCLKGFLSYFAVLVDKGNEYNELMTSWSIEVTWMWVVNMLLFLKDCSKEPYSMWNSVLLKLVKVKHFSIIQRNSVGKQRLIIDCRLYKKVVELKMYIIFKNLVKFFFSKEINTFIHSARMHYIYHMWE